MSPNVRGPGFCFGSDKTREGCQVVLTKGLMEGQGILGDPVLVIAGALFSLSLEAPA